MTTKTLAELRADAYKAWEDHEEDRKRTMRIAYVWNGVMRDGHKVAAVYDGIVTRVYKLRSHLGVLEAKYSDLPRDRWHVLPEGTLFRVVHEEC